MLHDPMQNYALYCALKQAVEDRWVKIEELAGCQTLATLQNMMIG